MALRGRSFSTISVIADHGLVAPAVLIDTDIVALTLTPSAVETQIQLTMADIYVKNQAPNRASTY